MTGIAGNSSNSWSQTTTCVVGRDDEMERIGSWFAKACRGEGGLVLLSGEAGIGKSTLCSTISSAVAGHDLLVLAGGCYEFTASPAYGPWLEIALTYSRHDNLPPLPDVLRDGSRLDTFDSQPEFFDLVRRFLSTVTEQLPVLLIIEDIHWADHASLDLVRYLSRTLTGHRLLMIATYRNDELAREHPLALQIPALVREGNVHRLHLSRLDSTAVLALVRGRYRLSAADEERLLSYLEERAEGNPFFITELLHTLTDRHLLRPAAGGWELDDLAEAGIPILVQQVIDARLTQLEPATRQMLELAAVIGAEPSIDLLQTLLANVVPKLDEALQEALDSHLLLLRPDRRLQFSHALVRQTIYASIPILRRQKLHRQVGDVLASRPNPDPDDVANHLYQAGDERAIGWLLESADRAASLYAPETVIIQCDRAIELASQLGLDPPGPAYRLRGLARELRSNFDGARDDLDSALTLAQRSADHRAEWQALLDMATLWASRDYLIVGDCCRQAVELARLLEDPEALGHSLNRLGNWYMNIDRPLEGLPYHQEALAIFEVTGDLSGVGKTHDLIAPTRGMAGDSHAAVQHHQYAIAALRQSGNHKTLASSLAVVSEMEGMDFTATRIQDLHASLGGGPGQLLAEALRLTQETGWRPGEAFVRANLGRWQAATGNYHQAIVYGKQAAEIAEDTQHHQWIALTSFRLGLTYRDLAAFSEAVGLFERALQIGQTINSQLWIRIPSAALALALILNGRYEQARQLLSPIIETNGPDTLALRECWYAWAELALAQGHSEIALETIDSIVESIPGERGVLSPVLGCVRAKALLELGRFDQAEVTISDAINNAIQLGFPAFIWPSQAVLCELYNARENHSEAAEARRDGTEIVERLAAGLEDEDLRTAYLEYTLARFPEMQAHSSRNINGDLTAREREVLCLVSEGLTDPQIAERLHISPRTVMTHVSHILAKLDAPNRTAASRLAVERNLL